MPIVSDQNDAHYLPTKRVPGSQLGSAEEPICLDDTLEEDTGENATERNFIDALFCEDEDLFCDLDSERMPPLEMLPGAAELMPTPSDTNPGLATPAIEAQNQNSGYDLRPRNNPIEVQHQNISTGASTMGYALRSKMNTNALVQEQRPSSSGYDLRSRSSNLESQRNPPQTYALRPRTNDVGNNSTGQSDSHPAGAWHGDEAMVENRGRKRRAMPSPTVVEANPNSTQGSSLSVPGCDWTAPPRLSRRRSSLSRGTNPNNPLMNRNCPPLLRARVRNAHSPDVPVQEMLSPDILSQSINQSQTTHPDVFFNMNQVPVPVPFGLPTSIYASNVNPNTASGFRPNFPVYAPLGNAFPHQNHRIRQESFGFLNFGHQSGISQMPPLVPHVPSHMPVPFNFYRNIGQPESFLEHPSVNHRNHAFVPHLPQSRPYISNNTVNLFNHQNPTAIADSFLLSCEIHSSPPRIGRRSRNPPLQDVVQSELNSIFSDGNLLPSSMDVDLERRLSNSMPNRNGQGITGLAAQVDSVQSHANSTNTDEPSTTASVLPNISERLLSEAEFDENYVELINLAERLDEERPGGLDRLEIDQLQAASRYKPENFENQATCVICMGEFGNRQLIRTLRCNHHYHAKCVDKWFKTNRTCPICRRDALE